MKRTKQGYTRKQYAYASRSLAPQESATKKEMALAVGYSPAVAHSVAQKIERTEGYSNAIAALASDAGNVALKIMHKLKHADLDKMSFETAVDQLTKVAAVFEKFTPQAKAEPEHKPNGLRAVILEHVTSRDAEPMTPTPHKVIDAQAMSIPSDEDERGY